MTVLSIFDMKRKEIPCILLVAGGVCGMAGFLATIVGVRMVSLYELTVALGAGIVLLLLALTTKMVGAADGVIVFTVGLVMGGRFVTMMFCVALLFASVYSGGLLLLRRAKRNSSFPFVPFLLVGCLFATALCGGRAWA